MNILAVNWQDLENPHAGGAEIHFFEIFGRLAEAGHRVRLVCSGWSGAPPRATIRGIEVQRNGRRNSFALVGRRGVRRAIAAERPDSVGPVAVRVGGEWIPVEVTLAEWIPLTEDKRG